MLQITSTEYLQALYGKCTTGDIVFVAPCRNRVSGYFPVADIEAAAEHIEANPLDLFIKVNVMDHSKALARSRYAIGGKDDVAAIVSFHLDVDAKSKNGAKYTDQAALLRALDAMPLVPSNIILTDGPDGGLHVYWLLDEPHYITDDDDRQRCVNLARNWKAELEKQIKAIDENATLDATQDLCRYLRPIGSTRKTGNRVDALKWNPERRYKLDQFALPEIATSQPTIYADERTEHDNVIERYLVATGQNSVESILTAQGYTKWKDSDRFLIRPGSSSAWLQARFTHTRTAGAGSLSRAVRPILSLTSTPKAAMETGTQSLRYGSLSIMVAIGRKQQQNAMNTSSHQTYQDSTR